MLPTSPSLTKNQAYRYRQLQHRHGLGQPRCLGPGPSRGCWVVPSLRRRQRPRLETLSWPELRQRLRQLRRCLGGRGTLQGPLRYRTADRQGCHPAQAWAHLQGLRLCGQLVGLVRLPVLSARDSRSEANQPVGDGPPLMPCRQVFARCYFGLSCRHPHRTVGCKVAGDLLPPPGAVVHLPSRSARSNAWQQSIRLGC